MLAYAICSVPMVSNADMGEGEQFWPGISMAGGLPGNRKPGKSDLGNEPMVSMGNNRPLKPVAGVPWTWGLPSRILVGLGSGKRTGMRHERDRKQRS